ncbi:MAG: xanthine/uracil permease family protein [Vampirovibrio sp.]|jgi:AGZA family xanthine/uracil permease-like MFS transporter|nr:xanthine/uracil permease family protein [Vampirovibrio sp.]
MISRYFGLQKLNTTVRQEALAGLTTFITMAYIIVVNPKILEAAGIPLGPSMVATILTAFIGTLLMGVYAKRPFAIAPYMGENAFVAYTLVKGMGYSWQTVLGAVFISALIFALLTVLKVRSWLVTAIPNSLKVAFSVGIGLFLAFIGLNETGIVSLGVPGAPVQVGNLTQAPVLLSLFCFLLMSGLLIRKVNGAILLGMLLTTLIAVPLGIAKIPTEAMSLPPSLAPILGKLDIAGALQPSFFPVIMTLFIILFVDTMGTLIGVSYTAGFLDKDGNLPEVEKPMLCDSVATMTAAVLGTTAAGAYIESAAGIESGGKSGLTSVVTALLFLVALLFFPILTIVPACAYGPALMVVGSMMLSPVKDIDFGDLTELIPAFITIALISFTYNLGIGMSAGFIMYPLAKLFAGRGHEIPLGLWVLALLSGLFFVVYPYH